LRQISFNPTKGRGKRARRKRGEKGKKKKRGNKARRKGKRGGGIERWKKKVGVLVAIEKVLVVV